MYRKLWNGCYYAASFGGSQTRISFLPQQNHLAARLHAKKTMCVLSTCLPSRFIQFELAVNSEILLMAIGSFMQIFIENISFWGFEKTLYIILANMKFSVRIFLLSVCLPIRDCRKTLFLRA
jgi:hypothetical protein